MTSASLPVEAGLGVGPCFAVDGHCVTVRARSSFVPNMEMTFLFSCETPDCDLGRRLTVNRCADYGARRGRAARTSAALIARRRWRACIFFSSTPRRLARCMVIDHAVFFYFCPSHFAAQSLSQTCSPHRALQEQWFGRDESRDAPKPQRLRVQVVLVASTSRSDMSTKGVPRLSRGLLHSRTKWPA